MEIASAFVTIRPQTDGFEAELVAAISGIGEQDISVTADTSDAEGAIDEVTGDVEVGVGADTSDAEAAIDGIESAPVEVPVTADTEQAQQSIDDLAGTIDAASGAAGVGGGAMGGLTTQIAGLTGVSTGATAGLGALVAGLGYAVSEGSDAQVTLGQLDQMVANMGANAGVTSGGLQSLATQLQQTAGFSDEAVMSGEAMVLMFENVRNVAGAPIFDRTIKSSADLARSPAFNGDIAGAARTLGRALDDPAAGMSRLRRANITFTEAQTAAITAMQESGDVAGAQAALLDVVDSKVGGLAERYGGQYAGGVDRAKEAVGEMAEAMGAQMLPALDAVSESVIDQVQRLNSWDDALNGALLSGPIQAIMGVGDAIETQGTVVEGSSTAWAGAAEQINAYEQAQNAAADALAATLPTLGGTITEVDRAGDAFGVLNASSNPQVVIDNLQNALFAWDVFQQRIATIEQLGPNIAGALQQLGPQVGGPLASALVDAIHTGNLGVVGELDALIVGVAERGGDVSAVMTGFAQNGMEGAIAAVQSSTGPMGAAGTAAGASGAAGIDAGLTYTNAAAIGAITGTQYGAGVSSGISGMYATVNAVANNVIAGAGNIGSAYSRGQSLGSAYGSGIVAGLAGQIGRAAATKASLDAVVESVGRDVGRGLGKASAPVTIVHQTVMPNGDVLAESMFEVDRRVAIAEGYEQ